MCSYFVKWLSSVVLPAVKVFSRVFVSQQTSLVKVPL